MAASSPAASSPGSSKSQLGQSGQSQIVPQDQRGHKRAPSFGEASERSEDALDHNNSILCRYACGGPYSMSFMMRSNQHAAWTCRWFHNAEQTLTRMANKDSRDKEALHIMKNDHPAEWAEKVRACRMFQGGSRTLPGRIALVNTISTVRQYLQVEAVGGVLWHTRFGFAEHQRVNYGCSKQTSTSTSA